jgi:hypothetical protein
VSDEHPTDRPRFAVGDAVRVRRGVVDPDYPDVPLGGWAGTVSDVDEESQPHLYLIDWADETLDAAHPVYARRCERDGLEVEQAWLGEDDLEPDDGSPLALEQPTTLTPRPLRLDDPHERALSVLGLTSDDELPPVTPEGLARFHAYLSDRLRFPFVAGHEPGDLRPLLVLRLLPPEEAQPDVGLMVEATVGDQTRHVPLLGVLPAPDDPAFAEIAAYAAWVGHEHEPMPDIPGMRTHPFVLLALVIGVLGAVAGAILGAVPGADWAAGIGAGLVAAVAVVLGAAYELLFRRVNHLPPGILGGAALGLAVGGAAGGLIGALVIAYVGTILGAIAGSILSQVLAAFGVRWPWASHWALGGACAGAVGYAFWLDVPGAARGALYGGLLGALVCGLVILAGIGYLAIVMRER